MVKVSEQHRKNEDWQMAKMQIYVRLLPFYWFLTPVTSGAIRNGTCLDVDLPCVVLR